MSSLTHPLETARSQTEYALDVLRSETLAFIHISKMNDPFDPYFFFELDFDGKYSSILNWAASVNHEGFSKFIQTVDQDMWTEVLNSIENYMEYMKKSTYLLSFIRKDSEHDPKDNILMWSHYAFGQRGILIEFDSKILMDSVIATNEIATLPTQNPQEAFLEVRYVRKLKSLSIKDILDFYRHDDYISASKAKLIAYFRENLCSKSRDWSYEREWRMLWRNDEIGSEIVKIPLRPGAVKFVYVGLSASDVIANEVARIAQENSSNFRVYKAIKRKGEFGLDFREVRYQ